MGFLREKQRTGSLPPLRIPLKKPPEHLQIRLLKYLPEHPPEHPLRHPPEHPLRHPPEHLLRHLPEYLLKQLPEHPLKYLLKKPESALRAVPL